MEGREFYLFYTEASTTVIYTLSLHDALPIFDDEGRIPVDAERSGREERRFGAMRGPVTEDTSDRKSTRLNSSHMSISYAVFCLKKKIQNANGHHPYSHWLYCGETGCGVVLTL